jgi:hypothetical protein
VTAFISGHRDISEGEFKGHYQGAIDNAIHNRHDFVICDYMGVDTIAQAYLNKQGVQNVTVFHMLTAPRVNLGGWPTVGGYISDSQRDAACTRASDYDIAWSRRDFSGTWENIQRRKEMVK